MHTMNTTTKALLLELAQTGQAIIIYTRTRDLHASQDLIAAGICHQSSTHHGFFIIKFGRSPITI
jgi:hypothetical protein